MDYAANCQVVGNDIKDLTGNLIVTLSDKQMSLLKQVYSASDPMDAIRTMMADPASNSGLFRVIKRHFDTPTQ